MIKRLKLLLKRLVAAEDLFVRTVVVGLLNELTKKEEDCAREKSRAGDVEKSA